MAPFLAGGILGAGIALLLAPKPGKELRKDVKRLAKDVKRFSANTGDRVTGAIEKGRDIVEDGAVRFADVIEDGKAVFVGQKKRLAGLIKPQRTIIGPVLAGSVGGAVLALLLTPKAGRSSDKTSRASRRPRATRSHRPRIKALTSTRRARRRSRSGRNRQRTLARGFRVIKDGCILKQKAARMKLAAFAPPYFFRT
jgi:gas vesicle protein